jgi:hypothetical protein
MKAVWKFMFRKHSLRIATLMFCVPIDGDWYPVPPEAVIKTENPVGEAIVWYLHGALEGDVPRNEQYRIICVPSGDV